MAFRAPLLFNYWGDLQSWQNLQNKHVDKRITKWLEKLKEETQDVQKVIIWYSSDIQSQLFFWMMCQLVEGELWGINIASLLDKERYVKTYPVHYLKKPIVSFCCRISCIYPEDLRAADCLSHIRRISSAQRAKNAMRFERIATKDKGLRVYRNGRILNVSPDFYDNTLIINIYNEILIETGLDVHAARLIGTCMADLPFEEEVCYISYFFYLRLEYLQKLGKMPKLVDMEKKNFKQF